MRQWSRSEALDRFVIHRKRNVIKPSLKTHSYMSLNKKILIVVLAISTFATGLTTFIQLGIDYQISKNDLNSEIDVFTNAAIPGIQNSVWQLNADNIKNQVDSSLTNIEFIEIKVLDENNELLYKKAKEKKYNSVLSQQMPLFNPNNQKEIIGNVVLQYTLDHIHHHIIEKIYSIVLFNFIKSVIISALLLQIFYSISVRRLNRISNIIKNNDWPLKSEPIPESTTWLFSQQKDEINNIESAFNEAIALISKNVNTITDNATSSARLAELGIFAAGIAHEINNPLAIITGNSAILEKELLKLGMNSEKVSTYIQRTNNSVDRIQKIISSIKLLSRDASQDEIETHSIQQIIEDTLVYCTKKLEISQTQFRLKVSPSGLQLKCRHVEISQVLLNLVNNSIDAIDGKENKWIELDFTQNLDQIICTFTDCGSGIPLEIQEKIFVPFYTTKTVGRGTGLGLALVQSVLQKNSATIKINSNSPHTQFVITFDNQSLPISLQKVA